MGRGRGKRVRGHGDERERDLKISWKLLQQNCSSNFCVGALKFTEYQTSKKQASIGSDFGTFCRLQPQAAEDGTDLLVTSVYSSSPSGLA